MHAEQLYHGHAVAILLDAAPTSVCWFADSERVVVLGQHFAAPRRLPHA